MRVTNSSMIRNHMYDTQQNLAKMNGINEQLNTAKMINRVSDDPHKAIRIMDLNNEIRYTEKYNYNIDEVVGWMETTDGSLSNLGGIFHDIKKEILEIGNGVYHEDELKAIQAEMNEKIKDIGNILNTTYAGKYMFGGTTVDEPPVKVLVDNKTGVVTLQRNPNSNSGKLKADIADGINVEYNISTEEILTDEHLKTVNALSATINAVLTGNKVEVDNNGNVINSKPVDKAAERESFAKLNEELEKLTNHALDERTSLGVKANTANQVRDLNDDHILNMKKVRSLDQDVDYVNKFIELKSAELVYQASIKAGTTLMQPTLLDYIR